MVTKASQRFIPVDRAAELLGVKPKTIRGWIHRGILQGRKDDVTGRLHVSQKSVHDRIVALRDGLDADADSDADAEGDVDHGEDAVGDVPDHEEKDTDDHDRAADGEAFELDEPDPPSSKKQRRPEPADDKDVYEDIEVHVGPLVFLGRRRKGGALDKILSEGGTIHLG